MLTFEEAVDEGRDALIRRDPVSVPAPEHCEPPALEGVGGRDVLEPLDEVPRVVGGLAFEGGGDDEDGAVLGEVRGGHVERLERGAEACWREERARDAV